MKIIFFGTPDFAVPSLDILVKSEHEVVAVVTAPDKERGRGRKVSYTPVKEYALQYKIPVLQPEKMKDEQFHSQLEKFNADLFVIVAFRILPEKVFSMPRFGSFNLHGSLLPKYRGAAPIQWAIMKGDDKTGLTTFFLEKKVDTGNMLLTAELPITDEDDLGSMHDKMSITGAELVLKTVNLIETGNYELKDQDDTFASPAPKITKETCEIVWEKPARTVFNQIRGLSPFPGAYFIHGNKQYKVYKSRVAEDCKINPAEIKTTKKEIYVGCSDCCIEILEIQPEGRKRMTAEEFLRGYNF
ncbi:MAG: methionyl-tRNA formyltransferase [Melioribacteraceae bacterium]|nr:MAG: methionyl-tRNA formyltransferase [Melioribacteraceae bacterium]